jgi:hypothetical protein
MRIYVEDSDEELKDKKIELEKLKNEKKKINK